MAALLEGSGDMCVVLFSPCSQQLVSAYMAHNFNPDFSLIRHGFPTTLAKGVRIIEGPINFEMLVEKLKTIF